MKREESRGAHAIQLTHSILHNMLRQAARERILGHNPMDAVERPLNREGYTSAYYPEDDRIRFPGSLV